ncbi:hypothetical protein [Campylobacter sp.]|uniref:phage tail fiber protein n=1 Tax=Campylobacter sp. TaxID=205 RepID=UPI0025C4C399|nr:hypothetical protein [Campylobacter sp.]
MNFNDISTLNASIVVAIGALPIKVDNFDPESDIFNVNDRQTADAELTPDGYVNGFCMRSIIETSFTLSGASKAAEILQGILNSQANGALNEATIIVTNNGKISTYGPGVLTSAKPAMHLGNQKVQPITFNFKFGNVF